ncbi:S-layer homology domain-containing protein [Pseudobacteroides cellulosolvens]|uniref:S-layer domain-containing protein n=1 Tax=Pseudobacteroides cellulosolvens ATCC 35603 = DSM 2933 TaxID=398512 RepID=A0A0L6JYB1_9FIRM|nr:S-layer homology domain-containing protein [Pseudobacteroides cellulosolvens]KNY30447.1 S-layer domain-containing protein [Pseudobacteroides cellulosolvens ATCC 35603 = DSM 2933]
MVKQKCICTILLISIVINLLPNKYYIVLADGASGNTQNNTTYQLIEYKWKRVHTKNGICLGLLDDNSLWQWCTSIDNSMVIKNTSPVKILENVIDVSVGYTGNILALTNDKKLWSWCLNSHAESKSCICSESSIPECIMDDVTNISAGNHTCLAVKSGGSLWGWGDNEFGQLGDGTTDSKITPIKIMDGVKYAISEDNFSLAIKNDNSLWSWGYNADGQLGNKSFDISTKPVNIMEDVIKVAATKYSSCFALKSDNTLWSWGNNKDGQLGDGQKSASRNSPQKILDNVLDVIPASYSTYAIGTDKTLYSWGSNILGRLGDGTTYDRSLPIKVMDSVAKISVSDSHIIALDETSSLWGWGSNNCSQVATTGEYVTAPSILAQNVIDLSTDNKTSSYITTDGKLFQLGQINGTNISIPKGIDVQAFIKSTNILNNYLEVHFSGTQLSSVKDSDFFISSITNGTEISSVTFSVYSFNPNTNTATLLLPEVKPAEWEKTVSYQVSYNNNMPVKTNDIIIKPIIPSTNTSLPTPTATSTSSVVIIPPVSPALSTPTASQTATPNLEGQSTSIPTKAVPGSEPDNSSSDKDNTYDEKINIFKKEILEIAEKFEGVDDPFNEKGDLITKKAEETIEEITSQKVAAANNLLEINESLILPKSIQALKAKQDIGKFLDEQDVRANRKIRATINIDVTLPQKTLDIYVINDIIPIMKKEIDIKVSTNVGNIVLFNESIEDQLSKDLIININDRGIQSDPKIKSNLLALLFKYKNGTTKNQLNHNIGIQLPFGNGNPEFSTILNKSKEKITNLGGHQDLKGKTLLTNTKSSGDYYVVENKKTFKDIENINSEIKKAIEVLASKGVISGRNEYTFDPDAKINRSEFTSLIVKDLGFSDENATINFKDVYKTAWYYTSVAVACKKGLINGYEDNTFRGGNVINKQEIVKICTASLVSVKGFHFLKDEEKYLTFKDRNKIPEWAQKYIALGNKEGLIVKRSNGLFSGTLPCNRGDAAVIMYRLYLKL